MSLPIPPEVIYAGLGGTLLALIVATAQQNWQCKVFFLLALRLAIGWHFLFEGMHKIHSHFVGPTETNRPFSSEPYFKAAPTTFGMEARKRFFDASKVIHETLSRYKEISPEDFAKLNLTEQAAACPPVVAAALEKAASAQGMAGAEAAKARYARWVFGVDGRDTKVKFVENDAALSAVTRLEHLEWLRKQYQEVESRRAANLGNGPTELKRASEVRNDLNNAENDLAKDALAFIEELQRELNGGKPLPQESTISQGQMMDQFTMWFIAGVGACILFGLFTPLACVLAAGFLMMTYLTHPAVPWYPLPPNTEGNPLFINKNVIEALALLSLACMPTGRWLGLDALLFGDVRPPKA